MGRGSSGNANELLSSLGDNHLCLRFTDSSKMLSTIPKSCPRSPRTIIGLGATGAAGEGDALHY